MGGIFPPSAKTTPFCHQTVAIAGVACAPVNVRLHPGNEWGEPVLQNRVVRTVALLVSLSTVAVSQVAAAEEKSLEDLLLEKGVITAEERDGLKEDAPAPVSAAAAEEEPKADEGPDFKVRVNHKGLAIESADGAFVFAFGGRLQTDAAVFINDRTQLGDGIEIRRARIKSYGTVYSDWDYKLEVNFDTNSEVSLTDAWLRYAGFKPFTVTVGHQKVPFGQQSMTSSNFQVFQERALPDAFIDNDEEGRRRLGVVLGSYGEHWNVYTGFFGQGVSSAGSKNSDWGAAGRAVWAPMAGKTKVLTFGGSLYYRNFESASELEYSDRPEAHLAGAKLVDTGELVNANDTLQWNFDTSLVLGPFHAQGEFTAAEVTLGNARNPEFYGWYVQSGVFLTGESRNYDVKSGSYKGVTPLHSYGAWELAARFSSIDLQSNGVPGGREDDVTVGVNWWVNPNILFRFNYVYGDVSPNSAVTLNGRDEQTHAFTGRAQIVF